MSISDGTLVWIGDLDDYIDIDAISRDYMREIRREEEQERREKEQERLDHELDEIGDLQLLAGKAISARKLYQQGILPSKWRHALHQAEMAIEPGPNNLVQPANGGKQSAESSFVKKMLDLGRPYAIARYTRWENLDYHSALTATFPYGIRALVNQLLKTEGITRTRNIDASISDILSPQKLDAMTAYSRTGLLQTALHSISDEAPTHPGGMKLDRERMRVMLSLARLYFSTMELKVISIDELRLLFAVYEMERATASRNEPIYRRPERDFLGYRPLIKSWRKRHIQPLLNLYPYSIRHGLSRAMAHGFCGYNRTALVNELALAHCEILTMRRAGKSKSKKNE